MAPWTNAHTNITARSDLAPVFKTALFIQLPAQRTVDLDLIMHGNGIGGTAYRAFFTIPAKIFNPDVHRFVGYQRQIGGHGGQPDPGPEFFGDQIPEAPQLAQARFHGQRNQKHIIMPEVVGGRCITQISDEGRQLGRDKSPPGILKPAFNGSGRMGCGGDHFK